jgi:hypothetical protein
MKKFTKVALGALMLACATTAVAAPASARVFVGMGGPVAYSAGPVCAPVAPLHTLRLRSGPTTYVGGQ